MDRQTIIKLASERSCFAFTKLNGIKTSQEKLMEFVDRRFLIDVFDDWSPILTADKSSQCGFSELMQVKAIYAAHYKGYNVIYTLPTWGATSEFVSTKTDPIINANPVLREKVSQDKDSIFLKKIGKNFIHFRGAHSSKEKGKKMEGGTAISISSDLNIHDEADRSDRVVLEQYQSRLDASDFKGRWFFSNKSHPGTLQCELFEQSDQKHWYIKCPKCNHYQYLDYPDSIQDGKYICQKCKRELDDETRRRGVWVKKYRDRDISGYWINQLMYPWKIAKEIEKLAQGDKQYFMNFVMGRSYIGTDSTVDRDTILKAIDYQENKQKNNVMGVDTGLPYHYVIGNKQGIFKIGTTSEPGEIERLMAQYDIGTLVFDALGDLTAPRKIQAKYPGIVWLCYFRKNVNKSEFVNWDTKTHTVTADRTRIIQQVVDEFVDRELRIQMKPDELISYIDHWGKMFKLKEENALGAIQEVWSSSKPDHYAFATVYYRLAQEKSPGNSGSVSWKPPEQREPDIAPRVQEMITNLNQGDWRI